MTARGIVLLPQGETLFAQADAKAYQTEQAEHKRQMSAKWKSYDSKIRKSSIMKLIKFLPGHLTVLRKELKLYIMLNLQVLLVISLKWIY